MELRAFNPAALAVKEQGIYIPKLGLAQDAPRHALEPGVAWINVPPR